MKRAGTLRARSTLARACGDSFALLFLSSLTAPPCAMAAAVGPSMSSSAIVNSVGPFYIGVLGNVAMCVLISQSPLVFLSSRADAVGTPAAAASTGHSSSSTTAGHPKTDRSSASPCVVTSSSSPALPNSGAS